MGLERGAVCSRGSSVKSSSGRRFQWMSSAGRPGSRMGSERGRDAHGLGGDRVTALQRGQVRIVKWCEGSVTGV